MRSLFVVSALLIVAAVSGCAGKDSGGAQTTPASSTAPVVKKDAVVLASAEVTKDRTVRIVINQDSADLKSSSYTATPAEKNVKKEQFTQSVGAKNFNVRVFEGSNPVGTDTVQPQTCTGAKVIVEIHLVDDAVHPTWKCG